MKLEQNDFDINEQKKAEIKLLFILFFSTAFIEVFAEYFEYKDYVYILKPLLIPILTLIYWKTSSVRNFVFISALFFIFLANIFFISVDGNSVVIGSIFYILYRILIIYIVVKYLDLKNYLPVFLGGLPFLLFFGYIALLTNNKMGDGVYIFLLQVLLMSFMAGYSLAAYIIIANRKNYWLLLGSLLFCIVHLMVVLKIYFMDMKIFQPIAMICYVVAQYSIYKFVILSEKKRLDDDFSST